MRTPAGKECKFFYGNYFRGRNDEECRLIGSAPPPKHWTPDLCARCPVPEILQANSCEHMELSAEARRALLGLVKSVNVSAYCRKSNQVVTEPHVGCGQCHPLPDIFTEQS